MIRSHKEFWKRFRALYYFVTAVRVEEVRLGLVLGFSGFVGLGFGFGGSGLGFWGFRAWL